MQVCNARYATCVHTATEKLACRVLKMPFGLHSDFEVCPYVFLGFTGLCYCWGPPLRSATIALTESCGHTSISVTTSLHPFCASVFNGLLAIRQATAETSTWLRGVASQLPWQCLGAGDGTMAVQVKPRAERWMSWGAGCDHC